MRHFFSKAAGNGVFGHFCTFMGNIWATQNALTILVITRNLHYLINKDEDRWKAVVKYCLVVLIERPFEQDDA
ncbi:MAG: hypothetical protein U5N56_05555 [Candidatus Marinimicrobia bacterium]|nr:hypothetical protein [Candidatus Neomarinimicrobiota bacterium]